MPDARFITQTGEGSVIRLILFLPWAKSRIQRSMKRLTLLSALLALAACKSISIPGFGSQDIEPVPLADSRILFEAPVFAGRPIVRAKFTDDWQREEYARFAAPNAQAEVVYIAATARETSLDYETGLRAMVDGWNFNAGTDIAWGDEFKALAAFGAVFVVPYAQRGNACFGFSAEWAVALDDPGLKPTKTVFGYYCERSEKPLPKRRIEAMVDSIEVSRFAGGSTSSAPPASAVNADGGKTGNPDFPFLYARGYISEGPSYVNRAY